MIQDIYPHHFHNEYIPKDPRPFDYVFSYDGNNVLLNKDEQFFHYQDIGNREVTYLFQIDNMYFYLSDLSDLAISSLSIQTLRSYQPQELAFAAITGWQLYQWMSENKYCGKCGSRMEKDKVERAMRCPVCNHIVYPKIMPAVIVGILNDKDEILVTKYAHGNYQNYALVAGFAEIGETIEETVKREVKEETGLDVTDLKYYKSQPWSFSSTLLFGFFCRVKGKDEIHMDHNELRIARWANRSENIMPKGNASLTGEMIQYYLDGKDTIV